MEFILNLAWAIVAVLLLGFVYQAARLGAIRTSTAAAMCIAVMLAFILLPAISITDDLIAAQQAALPLSGQTWRLASEDSASGLELLAIGLYLALLMSFLTELPAAVHDQWSVRPLAGRLARSQRLRPPPALASV